MNSKRKVILQPIKFRKIDHVAIITMYNPEVDEIVRDIEGIEWSTGYRFWHLPIQNNTIQSLKKLLSKVCIVDAAAFKDFKITEVVQKKSSVNRKHRNFIITTEQKEWLKKVDKTLSEKGYSDNSIKVFYSLLRVYFSLVKERDIFSISNEEMNAMIENYITSNSLSPNYKNLLINAIQKFYSIAKG